MENNKLSIYFNLLLCFRIISIFRPKFHHTITFCPARQPPYTILFPIARPSPSRGGSLVRVFCWSHYHTPQDLAVSISIEAAELLEIFPWGIRGTNVNQEKLARVKEELAPLLSKHSKPPPRPFSRALIAFLTKNIYSSPADKNRCKCRLTRIPERFSLAIERTHIQFLYKPVISRGFFVGLGDTRGDMGEGGRLVF